MDRGVERAQERVTGLGKSDGAGGERGFERTVRSVVTGPPTGGGYLGGPAVA